jgi:drug/metabolite transporter (DMT)-like permease
MLYMSERVKEQITVWKQKVFTGDILVLSAMAIFGSFPLFFRLYPEIHPLTFVFAFQIVGAIAFFFLGVFSGFPRLGRKDWMLLAGLAFVALANDFFYFTAINLTSVENAAVSHQSVSVFLFFLAPLILKERTRRDEWIAFMISILGIFILYSGSLGLDVGRDLLGITSGVLSGFFLALLIILYRVIPDLERGINIRVVNFWRYSISAVLLLPFASIMGITTITSGDIIPLATFGILFAVIASGIHHYALRRTRSLHASILGKSEPVFAITYAFFILHEQPTVEVMIGGTLIIGSSIWLAFRKG